jgi:hypothetical protein
MDLENKAINNCAGEGQKQFNWPTEYLRNKHERRILRKLQRGLTAVKSCCERWNVKINEGKIQESISLVDLQFLTMYYS